MANLLSLVCLLNNLPGPPYVVIQNGTFQPYTVNRRICPIFDQYKDTTFELYTINNPTTPQYLYLNNVTSVNNSFIDFTRPTKMFFHGFLEASDSDNAVQMRNRYLELGDYNVIIVNNRRLLAGPDYLTAAFNCEPIGNYSATFLDFLVGLGLKVSDLHVIGMSLGAHIAGFTGKFITSGRPSRVTGLDPAGPIFSLLPQNKRISKGDGDFVDIVHTNAWFNGIYWESGDVDVWVNGGVSQPGCGFLEVLERNFGSISELIFCNHYQSYRMYVMSLIEPESYQITQCQDYQNYLAGNCDSNNKTYLGVNIDTSASGNYYIKTNETALSL